ncbi:MAG: hypothetical protein BMS9Abin05_2144 [Rhodothermia bacterium]|nr:MAG: hypothetical protein BMS9Abin05_2144 [Rhodothermia bacterium]
MAVGHLYKSATIVILLLIVGGLYLNYSASGSEESLFEKQERCANNRVGAIEKLVGSYQTMTPYFYEIFYSPKTDTCVYTHGVVIGGESPDELGSFKLKDYFTGEDLEAFYYDNASDDVEEWSSVVRPKFREAYEKYR